VCVPTSPVSLKHAGRGARTRVHIMYASREDVITNQQYSIQNFLKITRQKPQAHASTETQQPPL